MTTTELCKQLSDKDFQDYLTGNLYFLNKRHKAKRF
jgi:hypothetical protein